MSARRIARELAVILLPQLPKDKTKLARVDLDAMVTRAVQMLTDYSKQCLSDANAFLVRSQQLLLDQEIEHPENARQVDQLVPVELTTGQLREHLDLIERALHLASEALDIPQMAMAAKDNEFLFNLVSAYLDHKSQIDEFIGQAKSKWRVERMVSIDRDILRLACAEAFYLLDVPVNVAISEAVELSHRFADAKAAKFINGILGDLSTAAKEFRNTGRFAYGDVAPGESVGRT